MGLTIHYNGCFKKSASLSAMVEEVKEIAEVYSWDYHIYKNRFPDNALGKTTYNQSIYGISVVAPGCEPLHLSFLSNGKMSSKQHLDFLGNSDNEKERRYLTMLSTKTQYAGIETHKVIIHLLKYLKKKYLSTLEVADETGYWETGDEKLLVEQFESMNKLLDQVWFGLENFPKNDGEPFETYFERLIKSIRKDR